MNEQDIGLALQQLPGHPPEAPELFDAVTRRVRRHRRVRTALALALVLVAAGIVVPSLRHSGNSGQQSVVTAPPPASTPAAAGPSAARPVPGTVLFDLPSNGWKPGQLSMLSITMGTFHAVHTTSGACAWLGNERPGDKHNAFLWPSGYRVRFSPTVLVDAHGHVVAREGQRIEVGGGFTPALSAGTRCSSPGQLVWSVMSGITAR